MALTRKELTRCLKALANERRIRIVQELLAAHVPLDIDAIARRIRLSYPSTTKHVAQLERCDFLERTRTGITVYYRVRRSSELLASVLRHLQR